MGLETHKAIFISNSVMYVCLDKKEQIGNFICYLRLSFRGLIAHSQISVNLLNKSAKELF